MKKLSLIAVLLIAITPAVAQPARDVYSRPERVEIRRDIDVLHYAIHIRFDAPAKTFWGEDTVTLVPTVERLQTVKLDAERMTITAVKDLAGKPLQFTQDEHSVTVQLPRVAVRSSKVVFTLSYVSRQSQLDSAKYGMDADYHLGLTFWDATPEHPALIATMSFPEGARHWFPSNDVPGDKATSDIFITVDEDQKAVSNGRLVEVKENKARHERTFHWAQEKPHSTYLFVIVVGPYATLEGRYAKLPLKYWVYPKDVKDAPRSFERTPEILDFFAKEFGYPYPWAKYDQITIPGIGGGAECTSATVLSQGTIHDARAEQDFPSAWLVAHEAAHQWWGDLVTFRTWKDTWLNESFATYSEYLYARHASGEDEGAVNLRNKKLAYLREAHEKYMRPISFDRYDFPNELFDRHSYEKGALVLHMLRFVVGEKAFRAGIEQYLQEHAFGSAETGDFQRAMERTYGQPLAWFFDEWLYRPGHPVLNVSYRWDESRKKVVLHVDQIQERRHGTPIFRAPVMIGVTTASGTTTTKIWLEKESQEFDLDAASKPLMVRFDSGNQLLAEITFAKDEAELLFGLAHDDVIGRIWAAGELAKGAVGEGSVAALKQAARQDAFWAVRAAAVDALAKWKRADDLSFFREMALDKNSKVRVASLRALAAYKNRELLPFFIERAEKDDSYLAQAEALRAMGSVADAQAIVFLERAAEWKSPRNVLNTAAEAALKEAKGGPG